MVYEACTPHFLWSKAVNTTNYLTNRSPTRPNLGVTPFQKLYYKLLDLSRLRNFGCLAFIHIPIERCSKLDAHSTKTNLVGYSEQIKGYCFYDPNSCKLILSNDIKFAEHRFWHLSSNLATPQAIALEPLSDRNATIEVLNSIIPSPTPKQSIRTLPSTCLTFKLFPPLFSLSPLLHLNSLNPSFSSDSIFSSQSTSPPPLRVYTRRCLSTHPPSLSPIPSSPAFLPLSFLPSPPSTHLPVLTALLARIYPTVVFSILSTKQLFMKMFKHSDLLSMNLSPTKT